MENKSVLYNTIDFVKQKLSGDSSGHDWWHIYRVVNIAKVIQKKEGGNLFIIELAALLHDVADWKFNTNESEGLDIVSNWLKNQKVSESIIQEVLYIIRNISFKGEGAAFKMESIEGQIVQDADRIDAIGAIGIARTFAFGGWKGNEICNPEFKPVANMNFDQYKKSDGTTINHFYEKLLLLKDRMNTNTGREIAFQRHTFMQHYLDQFFKEWEGLN